MRNLYLGGLVLAAIICRHYLYMPFGQPLISPVQVKAADFPRDLPMLPQAEIESSEKRQGMSFVSVVAKQDPAAAFAFYEHELPLQGWSIVEKEQLALTAEKEDRPFAVRIIADQNGGSQVTIVFK